MATCSSRRTGGLGLGRPISPATPRSSAAAPFASSTAAAFSSARSPSSAFRDHHQNHHRSASPTRINLVGPATAVRSQIIGRRSSSPASPAVSKKTCLCSPTTHPGSFRCSLHKGFQSRGGAQEAAVSSPSNRLNMRRSAMTNSLVRIGTVEGDLMKRALAALIRPSSHQQRRREAFQPRPSRLSIMSKADD